MRVISGAGEFEISIETIDVRPDAMVLIGKMGVWEAETIIGSTDLGIMARLCARPRVLVWILRQLFTSMWNGLRRRKPQQPS